MTDPTLQLSLEIEARGDGIGGWVREPAGRAQRFDSWLELVRALDQAIASVGTGDGPGDPDGDR